MRPKKKIDNNSIREPANPLTYGIYAAIRRLLFQPASWRLKYIRIEGATPGGLVADIHYIGDGESLNYLKETFFTELRVEENIARVSAANLPKAVDKLSDKLVIVEVNRRMEAKFPPGGYRTYPWVRRRVELTGGDYIPGSGGMDEGFSERLKQDAISFRMTGDEMGTKHFYHDMYEPSLKRLHKGRRPLSRPDLMWSIRKGALLQVFEGDRWISGAICRFHGHEATLLAVAADKKLGPADRRYAIEALHYNFLKWAEEHGVERVNFLKTRPHGEDPDFSVMDIRGARIVTDVWPHTFLNIFVPEGMAIPPVIGSLYVKSADSFVALGDLLKGSKKGLAEEGAGKISK